MTPNEISVIIAERTGQQLDIPFRLLVFSRFKLWRSTLVKNTLQKDPSLKGMFTQTLILKTVPFTTGDCVGVGTGSCYDSARTEVKIPLSVKTGGTPYDYVGGIYGTKPYNYAHPTAARYKSKQRYAGVETVYWNVSNGYIVLSTPVVSEIRIDDVFDDPLEVEELICSTQGQNCDIWNKDYPATTKDIIQQAIDYVVQSFLQPGSVPAIKDEVTLGGEPQASK